MNVAESIYQGYVTTRGAYENPQEIRKAVLELSEVVQKLIPASTGNQELQDNIIGAAVELVEQTEKQGFITGFQYATQMFGSLSEMKSAFQRKETLA